MKNGDLVLMNWYNDNYNGDDKDLMLIPAMIVRVLDNNTYLTVYFQDNSYGITTTKNIAPIIDIEIHRNKLSDYYDEKINVLKSKIKYVTQEDKDKEKAKKYDSAKQRLLMNCRRLLIDIDDEDLLNRVKEINNLKGQIRFVIMMNTLIIKIIIL